MNIIMKMENHPRNNLIIFLLEFISVFGLGILFLNQLSGFQLMDSIGGMLFFAGLSLIIWLPMKDLRGKVTYNRFFAIIFSVSLILSLFAAHPLEDRNPPDSNPNNPTPDSDPDYETNFVLKIGTLAGSKILQSYAFFVKQALLPLGIDVIVQAMPYQQLHDASSDEMNWSNFDLFISSISFPFGSTPELMWKYHSDSQLTIMGDPLFDFSNPVWREWQGMDTGITQDYLNLLLSSIDGEINPMERLDLINQFTKVFYEKLLYDLPLTSSREIVAVQLGYGDDNNNTTCLEGEPGDDLCSNDLYDPDEGLIQSRALGAGWHPFSTPEYRQSKTDLETLQLRILSLPSYDFYNPYLTTLSEPKKILDVLTEGLLNFDKNLQPHPGIAYNFIEEDWVKPANDTIVENGKITFFLNANQAWRFTSATTYHGSTILEEVVDAADIGIVVDLLTTHKSRLTQMDPFNFEYVSHWTINSTVFTNDTITFYFDQRGPNDIYNLGNLTPLPYHILGRTLHDMNGTTYSFSNPAMNPLHSLEWQHSQTPQGKVLVGPFDLGDTIPTNQSNAKRTPFELIARDDFPYPNEWDTQGMYEMYSTNYSSYETSYNLSYFAPHINAEPPKTYYWGFVDDSVNINREKPNSQNIRRILYRTIDDDITAMVVFEAAELDMFVASSLGPDFVEDQHTNDDIVVRTKNRLSSPISLVFNLENEHLRKFDVRYAIASSIDREEMTIIIDGLTRTHDALVTQNFDLFRPNEFAGNDSLWDTQDDYYWYSSQFAIEYSYDLARDLMQTMGYFALEHPDPETVVVAVPILQLHVETKELSKLLD